MSEREPYNENIVPCKNNIGVNCPEQKDGKERCNKCGWDPMGYARRMKALYENRG